ncbi:Co-chaperone Hsc20 [Hypoxylon sp. NC1633]|nr:Co-chaperone Hsc20 [Hypoxylon sp. NC1633]
MRSSSRPLRRVYNACAQQPQRSRATSAFTYSTTATSAAPSPSLLPRQTASSRPKAQPQRITTPTPASTLLLQARNISSSASRARESSGLGSATKKEEEGQAVAEAKTEAKTKTHYDLFPQTLPLGPPPRGPFAIDGRALRREFLTLQATAHPDVAQNSGPGSGSGPRGKRAAEAASAHINEAYRTLLAPLARAQYLLQLRGLDVAADETARVEDPDLLMLVLETREAIEEAASEDELEPLRLLNEDRIRESEGRLADAFGRDDVKGACREVTRLRYWVNVRESIQNWERGKPVVLVH